MTKVADMDISTPPSIRDQGGESIESRSSHDPKQQEKPPQDSSLSISEESNANELKGQKNASQGPGLDTSEESNANGSRQLIYQTGWRLHILTLGLCLGLLLSTLETTIVSTSLISIVNALHGFDQSSWVVTSYLLTYTGFLIIYAKLSNILGCKLMLLLGLCLFTVFSIACGFSTSMLQLIVFRAFQGMGASGIYSLVTVMVPLMVPPEKYATYIAAISSVFAVSSVLGPILGGAINDHSSWKWVFLLNAPAGAAAIALLACSISFSFPYKHSSQYFITLSSRRTWNRVDFIGAFMSLAASILLVFGLQQAGIKYPWHSGTITSTLVLSGVLWIGFVWWEKRVELRKGACEPMFPWRLACNRRFLGLLLNAFFTGFPFMAAIINIPQRLQAVNETSAIGAGIRLLPLLLCSPIATALSGFIISKFKVPPFYLLVIGASLQLTGVGLFSSLSTINFHVSPSQYGFQVIMGFGFGFSLSTVLMMARLVVKDEDLAVGMGSITQIRVLGGTIGLAICSTVLNNHIKSETSTFLTAGQVASLLQSTRGLETLTPQLQDRVRSVYASGYSQQMRIMTYFCAAVLVSLVLLVEKNPRKLETIADAGANANGEATGRAING